MVQTALFGLEMASEPSIRAASTADGTLALPRPAPLPSGLALPRVKVTLGPLAGTIALASMVLGVAAIVAFAASGPSVLVPRSNEVFPPWEAGPLHAIFSALPRNGLTLQYGLSAVVVVMTVAYFLVAAAARTMPMRRLVIAVLALHVILLMSPPLGLTDLFNYIGYARLGALHSLNPYTHVIAGEQHDPVYVFTTWHRLHSPYGPLFTALSYLLPVSSLSLTYWLLKTITVIASLGFLALVWQCARALGRDPRVVVAFVAFNPIYLVYAVGGFHNDFFMLIPMLGAIALVLARRDRWAGAVLMLAVAVKFTAILLLPFLLVAVVARSRQKQIVLGAVLGAIPLAAMSLALFGLSIPNLQDQSTLLTDYSIPNVVGLALHIGGGTPLLLHIADAAAVIFVIALLRRRGDWLASAGWATLALLASLAWLMPWYVTWLTPLAALGTSPRLRRATLALTLFLVVTFIPATNIFAANHHLSPMATSAGHRSLARQAKLEQ